MPVIRGIFPEEEVSKLKGEIPVYSEEDFIENTETIADESAKLAEEVIGGHWSDNRRALRDIVNEIPGGRGIDLRKIVEKLNKPIFDDLDKLNEIRGIIEKIIEELLEPDEEDENDNDDKGPGFGGGGSGGSGAGNGGETEMSPCTIQKGGQYSVEEFDKQFGESGCCKEPPNGSHLDYVSHYESPYDSPRPTLKIYFTWRDGGWRADWEPEFAYSSIGQFCEDWRECRQEDYVISRFGATPKDTPRCNSNNQDEENEETQRIPDMNEECCGINRRIWELLGGDKFPMQMPKNITVDPDNPSEQVEIIEDYADAYAYRFDIDDERWGQFQIPIEVKDIDPTTKGDQTEKVKLANLAEAIAELFGLVYTLLQQSAIISDVTVKTLVESGNTRITALRTGYDVEELIEYIGFASKEVKKKVKTQFSPEGQGFDEFLKPSQQEFKYTQNIEKKTLQEDLQLILEAGKIIRTVFGLEVSSKNPELGILEHLSGIKKHFDDIDDVLKENKEKSEEAFKEQFPDIEIESDYVADQDKLKGF